MLHHHKPKTEPLLRPRLVPRGNGRRFKVVRIGDERLVFRDLYARILMQSWWVLLLLVCVFYLLSNVAFASGL